MSLTLYIDRPATLQRLHPTVKLVGMLALFTVVFLGDRLAAIVPLSALVFGLIWSAGAWENVVRLRLLLGMVFTMTFIIWSVFYPDGEPLLRLGPLTVSAAGMHFALATAFKLASFVAAGILFLSVTKIEEFAYALHRLGMPYKLAFTITLTFRLVPVFLDSATSVVQAQRCRGFDFDRGGLVSRLRRYVPVLVPVFISALRRADGMAAALDARGFQAAGRRTSITPYRFGAIDAWAMAAVAGMIAGYGWLWKVGMTAL